MQGDTVQEPAEGAEGAQQGAEGAQQGAETAARERVGGATDVDRRMLLVTGHLLLGAGVLALWAAADAWQAVTGLAAGAVLSVLLAVPAGVVFSTLVHEWCHFLGARLAGSAYRVPARFGLFVFDFDYRANSVEQFRLMSYAGQAGSLLAVILLWLAVPLDTAGRAMLLSAAIGSGVFGALIEWPVLARVSAGVEPLASLGQIDKPLLYRSAATAGALILLLWLLLS